MENIKNIKKIDIHAHGTAFPQYLPSKEWVGRFCSGEETIAFYDKLNIEKGVLLPVSSPEAFVSPMTSENCKYITTLYPDRFLWFCNVDPRALTNEPNADLKQLLVHYKKLGALGVGEVTAQIYADDPKLDNLFGCCEELDMPVLIHIAPKFGGGYGIVDDLGLPRIEKMLKKHPNLKLIGHSQPFWAEISADLTEDKRNDFPKGKVTEGRVVELMCKYPNLYCDLSAGSGANAMMRDEEFAMKFFAEFRDRILYGCDICDVSNTHPFMFNDWLNKMVEEEKLPVDIYRKIVRENAIRLLKLEEK